MNLINNLDHIKERIKNAAEKAHRNVNEITLVGVSKKQPINLINFYIEKGLNHIGENIVQEAEYKFPLLRFPVTKHFIGTLQTNKVNKAVKLFDTIQTVDKIKTLEKISQAALKYKKTPYPIFFQVNFSHETTKQGCTVEEVYKLADLVMNEKYTDNIRWDGLMTIAPLNATSFDEKISFYKSFYELFKEIKNIYPNCSQLSMGMSSSFEEAILAGATIVRIGTALFGERIGNS